MGPPIEKLVSQFRMIVVGLGMPNDRSSSSTLLLCAQDPARLEKKLPEKAHAIPNGSAHDFVIEAGEVSILEFNGAAIDPAIRTRAPLALELTRPS